MSGTLRSHLIRLANSRPDLRPHLLPLVSDTALDDAALLEQLAKVTVDGKTWADPRMMNKTP
jgi:hypothetical protein